MSYVYALEEKLKPATKRALMYKPFEPQHPVDVNADESIIKQVSRKDILLCYPYESMEPFLRLMSASAAGPGCYFH